MLSFHCITYDVTQVTLPGNSELELVDFTVMNDPVRTDAIADAKELMPLWE
ncbi:MAG: hypothetical protein HKN57_07645 [Xanthomonadales bacterium]|nr:hypothetical protein [Gammaproteobacteria bacterium]MBT8052517.1 hypothetical protein [Gammaproteobacteria bacterium]NND57109.1 hypothetical protein [Xanthomonadales bacterium]NNK52759.1 hypothetical protein [Xanthomonadales bacterium]